jgi:hypothetical protein
VVVEYIGDANEVPGGLTCGTETRGTLAGCGRMIVGRLTADLASSADTTGELIAKNVPQMTINQAATQHCDFEFIEAPPE